MPTGLKGEKRPADVIRDFVKITAASLTASNIS